jgi:hypothetical protein
MVYNYLLAILPPIGLVIAAIIIVRLSVDPSGKNRLHPGE